MSHEHHESGTAEATRPRRRLYLTIAGVTLGVAALAVPAAAALKPHAQAGSAARPTPSNSPPGEAWKGTNSPPPPSARPGPYAKTRAHTAPGMHAYVALAGGFAVADVDVTTHKVTSEDIKTDAAEGAAVTKDGKTLYLTNTGQYEVLAVDTATKAQSPIHIGDHARDLAMSPDGSKLYVAVTGGDTGSGGSATVAVIDTGTNRLTHRIHVGTAPRHVAFDASGKHAYVTTERGISVIDTQNNRVTDTIGDKGDPEGVAVNPKGHTLYVTDSRANQLRVIDTRSDKVRTRIPTGAQPWSVAVTPDGKSAYVAEMNSGTVAAVDTSTSKVRHRIIAGKLPATVAVTPDGSQVWVGNNLSGTISVIDPRTDRVVDTIASAAGTKAINSEPLGIAFTRNPNSS